MTFVVLAITIILAVLFSSDMVHKTNPIQSQTTIYDQDSQISYLINRRTFVIGIGVYGDYGSGDDEFEFLNEDYYSVEILLIGGDSDVELKWEYCSDDPDDYLYKRICISDEQPDIEALSLTMDSSVYIQIYLTVVPGPVLLIWMTKFQMLASLLLILNGLLIQVTMQNLSL